MTSSAPRVPRSLRGRLFSLGAAIVTTAAIAVYVSTLPKAEQTRLSPVQARSTTGEIEALGRLEPEGEVIDLSAPTSLEGSRVAALRVRQGDSIGRGQVVAVLDRQERLAAALLVAQKAVGEAEAKLAGVQAGAKTGELAAQRSTIARLGGELDLAQREYERYRALLESGAVAASLLDSKHTTVVNLEGQLRSALSTLNSLAEVRPTDLRSARAGVESARASVAEARANLETAYVRSLSEGRVLKIHTWPGEATGNAPILQIGRTERMNAVAEVYETEVSRVRLGQQATVTSANGAFPGALHGRVIQVGQLVDKKDVLDTDPAADIDARVVEVKIGLDRQQSRRVSGLTNLQVDIAIKTGGARR